MSSSRSGMPDPAAAVFLAQRIWCTVGAAIMGLSVVIGAFGAHFVKDEMPKIHATAGAKSIAGLSVPASYKYLTDYETGVTYQMAHGLAIIFVGLLGRRGKARVYAHAAGACFTIGVLLFSGSLYVLALTGVSQLGRITPIGGLAFIAGWVLFAVAAAFPRSTDSAKH